MSPEVELLARARALIADEGRWTLAVIARDKRGRPVLASSPRAVSWCALGALLHEAGDDADAFTWARWLLERAAGDRYGTSVSAVNDAADGNGHAAVLGLFDDARRRAEELDAAVEAWQPPPIRRWLSAFSEMCSRPAVSVFCRTRSCCCAH